MSVVPCTPKSWLTGFEESVEDPKSVLYWASVRLVRSRPIESMFGLPSPLLSPAIVQGIPFYLSSFQIHCHSLAIANTREAVIELVRTQVDHSDPIRGLRRICRFVDHLAAYQVQYASASKLEFSALGQAVQADFALYMRGTFLSSCHL